MLSTYFKAAFSNQSVMAPLRDAAKTLAKEFFDEGMKEYFTRWGDNVYDEGLTIKDDKLFKEYTQRITADLEAIKRQATIQKLYHDVKID
ncbi:hypothetical protein TRFO_14488 [Tritrichomonas foetus]|uniref:Uncharacterized protein n=1 Tax=Tritrichomonas foetus TaxID=1144522 RepID=A0A1J4KZV2_9EUKA|nr:hypothetical protein TRFO_14488 [Tritrichomonas foetus]|eukprot:OHT15125.1 hypothetical protein TRFO_14488 [Tritrichomonas foetus]